MGVTNRFIKAHSDLIGLHRSKIITQDRVAGYMLDKVESFCIVLEKAQELFVYNANNVVNYDETRVVIGSTGIEVLERVDRQQANDHGLLPKGICSLVSFICSSGKVIMLVFIIPLHHEEQENSVSTGVVL